MEQGPTGYIETLTFADLLSDKDVVRTKEDTDKGLVDGISTQSVLSLKPKLVEWVLKGCPNAFPILSIQVTPPSLCSDGQVRNLPEYIQFCSGKSIDEHVGLLQAKLPDISVSYANIGGNVTIVVSKV